MRSRVHAAGVNEESYARFLLILVSANISNAQIVSTTANAHGTSDTEKVLNQFVTVTSTDQLTANGAFASSCLIPPNLVAGTVIEVFAHGYYNTPTGAGTLAFKVDAGGMTGICPRQRASVPHRAPQMDIGIWNAESSSHLREVQAQPMLGAGIKPQPMVRRRASCCIFHRRIAAKLQYNRSRECSDRSEHIHRDEYQSAIHICEDNWP